MDKNPFLHRLIKENTSEIVHSSGYAQTGSMGSASAESFAKRREIDQNRTRVRSYNDSRIAASARNNAPRPQTYTPPTPSTPTPKPTPPPRTNPGFHR
ncbi:hypothetical protein IKF57_02825 [Candidatus Saccharibacteria bacterium]|nr:hypothetical protein [Candidatus Saccharibacteria bacterium]